MIRFLTEYSCPKLSQNPILKKMYLEQYLAGCMTNERKPNPIVDPASIMISLQQCNAVKQKLLWDSWRDIPEVRKAINLLENNDDQVINILTYLWQQYNNQNKPVEIYSPKLFKPEIEFYPGSIIFLNISYDLLMVNPQVDLVKNQNFAGLSNYSYPSQSIPLNALQFTSYFKANNNYITDNRVPVENINLYDNRLIFVLTTIASLNPDLKFKYNSNYYLGKIMDQTPTTTAIFLESSQEDPDYQNYQQIQQYTEGHVYVFQRSQPNYLQELYQLNDEYDLVQMKNQKQSQLLGYSTPLPEILQPPFDEYDIYCYVCLRKIQ